MKFDPVFPPYVQDNSLGGRMLAGEWPAAVLVVFVAVAAWLYFR